MTRPKGTKIRPVDAGDLIATCRWRNDPRVAMPSLGRRFPITSIAERVWFEGLGVGAFPTHVVWAVADDESQIVGLVQLSEIHWIHRTAQFGIWVGPEHWGQGHASRATRLVCDHAFDNLGLRQVRLSLVAGHEAARAVYEKNGFIEEAVQRGAVVLDGTTADLVLMVLNANHSPSRHGDQ